MSNEAILKKLNLPKNEEIKNQIPCFLLDYDFGVLYLTSNYLCFSSVIYSGKKIIIPCSEIISMTISKDGKKIIISSVVKIFRKSLLIFSNFSNIKKSFDLIDKNFKERKNINSLNNINSISHRVNYSNFFIKKEKNDYLNKLSCSTVDTSTEEEIEEDEIKFIEMNEESNLICLKQINLSSKEFFEKFFYSKDNKNDFSHPKFYETLEDHFNLKVSEWKEINLEDKNKLSKERNISFNLKLKGIPFLNESQVFSTQKFISDNKNNFYIINSTSKSEGIPLSNYFEIKDQYEIYPLNNNSCVLRISGYPNFIENTFFKIAIQNATKNTFKEGNEKWLNYLKNNGVVFSDYVNKKVIRKKKYSDFVNKTFYQNENIFDD